MHNPSFILWILIAYLIGSIPTGYWIGRLQGIDLTKVGSGSTGATNVLRNVGKISAILTLLIDMLKGLLPVYFSILFNWNNILICFIAIACIIGHSKSIFLKFKGGKSSATGLGIVMAISWQTALIIFCIWIVVVWFSKYSSLGSIIAVPLTPLLLYFFKKPMAYIVFTIFAAIYIIVIRHMDNIKRLLSGTEPKIGTN